MTTVAFYRSGDGIVAQSIDGKALIHHRAGRYRYQVENGDPLVLAEIVAHLADQGHVDQDGFIDDRALFEATCEHVYPDPLRRIWMAFDGLVQRPADLIVCLKDGWCHGSEFFNVMIGGATSTHGSLNQINSATFLLTMWGELPGTLRLEDVRPMLRQLQEKERRGTVDYAERKKIKQK